MRLLFDVLHPAHVHFFRPLAEEVRAGGGEVLFAARRKEVAVELLQAYDLPFRELSAIGGGPLGLAGELATRSARLASLCREFRPDALLGIMGPCIAPVGRLLGIPSLVCYDTETAGVTNRWVFPLATAVLTPRAWRGRPRRNQRQYDGTQELAYLHPRRFTPARTKTVISSERGVPASLADRVLDLPPADLHHALAAASLVVGEGATTAAEAAVLGTPAVFVHTARLGYMDELENRFGLLYRRTRQDEALRLSLDLLADPAQTAATWARRRQRLLESSVDVTDWLTATVADVVGSRSAE